LELPTPIVDFLAERSKNSNSPCGQCNAACCSGAGFALLENIQEIYKKYQVGGLKDGAVKFEPGLTLSQFIHKYFDRVVFNNSLQAFFPKTIAEDGGFNSIPPWNYYEARKYLEKRKKSYGCIFLAKRQAVDDLSHNYCTLHNEKFCSEITEKPIDCAFLNCTGLRAVKAPSVQETQLWFALLDFHFPGSTQRFQMLCPDIANEP
jgi:hypothetical protein